MNNKFNLLPSIYHALMHCRANIYHVLPQGIHMVILTEPPGLLLGYTIHGGRIKVLFKPFANANEPTNWSAWFPNLPGIYTHKLYYFPLI